MWVDDVDTGHKKKKNYSTAIHVMKLLYYLIIYYLFSHFFSSNSKKKKKKNGYESLEKYLNVMFLYVIHLKIINMTLQCPFKVNLLHDAHES